MTEPSMCKSTQNALWDFMSGALPQETRAAVEAHLEGCRECRLHRAEVASLSTGLKSLPRLTVSPLLETRMRVIASRERSRSMRRRTMAARFDEIWSRARLFFDNLLRPFAVPAAGGILASTLLFATIVDTLHYRPDLLPDIPIGIFTQAALEEVSPFTCNGKDVTVQLTLDADGQVIDYSVPMGNVTPDQLLEIGNLVLYSKFTPATSFGQPVPATFLVDIHHVKVRG